MENKIRAKDHKRLHSIWEKMKYRCKNKNDKNYGGRGITYVSSWETFQGFFDDMAESYYKHVEEYGEKDTTLDRIDVDGNYCSENCRWATTKEQAVNKRDSVFIDDVPFIQWCELHGINPSTMKSRLLLYGWDIDSAKNTAVRNYEHSIAKLCDEHNINAKVVYARLKLGWDLDKALTEPIQGHNYLDIFGRTLKEECESNDINYTTVRLRIQNGMSPQEAVSTPVYTPKYLSMLGMSLRELCRERNLSYDMVRGRLRRGWDLVDALSAPKKEVTRYKEYDNKTLLEICTEHAMDVNAIRSRLANGWTLDDALITPIGQKHKEVDCDE